MMMFSNSLRLRESSHNPQRHLKTLLGIGGRTAQLAGGYFDVLLLQGGDHVGRGQLTGRQLRRIQPDAHGILALAEDDDVADAGNALQSVLDVNIQVVGDVLVRKAVVGRVESGGKNEVGIRLGDGNAGVLDFLRQAALRRRHAVLHVDGGNVQVVPGAESYVDGAGAVVRTGRGDVVHSLDAVDLLLQRNRDRGLDHLRVRAHVVAADRNLRRRQIGIQRDRQAGNGNCARQNDQQGADRGKNWPLDEKINQTCTSSSCRAVMRRFRAFQTVVLDRLNRRAVNQELGAGDDDLFSGLQAVVDDIIVTDRIAQGDRALLGNGSLVGVCVAT